MKKLSKLRKYILNIIIILFSAFLVNVLTIGTSNTYSWFNDKKYTAVSANVVDAADIIKVEILYDILDSYGNYVESKYREIIPNDDIVPIVTNPREIKITRKDPTQRPNIYFDIKGDLAEYFLHIHPVDFLDEQNNPINDNIEIIKIVPICNPRQKTYLDGKESPNNFQGTLSINYLNGFINKKVTFNFLKSRLESLALQTINN